MDKIIDRFTPEIYKQLLDAVEKLPPEAIEKAKKEITRKGYDTIGYQYQFLVNVLNEVVGVSGWSYKYTTCSETSGVWSNNKSFHDICVDLELTILDSTKTAPGGHRSEMYSDAKKGAVTNALKKALGMFGVGKKAYEGTIDEDYLPIAPPEDVFVSQHAPRPVAKPVYTTPKKENPNDLPFN